MWISLCRKLTLEEGTDKSLLLSADVSLRQTVMFPFLDVS